MAEMTELQRLRREADMLFSRLKAKKRLIQLLTIDITIDDFDDIDKLQLQYDDAERQYQLRRKELGLPYILNDEEK